MECRELTCISCPMGCLLTVAIEGDQIQVTGNSCRMGIEYGNNEIRNPKRMITTSIPITATDGSKQMLSVKTSQAVPKGLIFDCLKEIKKTTLKGDFVVGDVVIANVLNLDIDIVATRAIQ